METTERTGMPGRLAGGVLVGALAVMITGAAIGFFAPSLREAPWSDDLQELLGTVAGNPTAYQWANGLILTAVILTVLGLVVLSIRFEGRSRPWAWMGLVAFAFAAVFEAIDRITSIWVTTWAAQQDLDVTDFAVQAFVRLEEGLSAAFYILGFLALSLYGIAIAQVERANELGWAFVVGGILGIVLTLVGAAIPVFVFFGTAALGAATWRLNVPPADNSQNS